MSYATAADFIAAFGEPEATLLTNLDFPTATAPNLVSLNKGLDDATATIDAYVGTRYLLPLNPLPTVVNRYCLDIARYMLDRVRSREDVRLRYEDAIKFFTLVGQGKASLGATLLGESASLTALSTDASGARWYAEPRLDLGGFDGG